MADPTLHVVFSRSAAGLLYQALKKGGRSDRILAFDDNLGFGPIDPPDPDVRLDWMVQELGVARKDWDWLPEDTRDFWSVALAANGRTVVWTTKRMVREYSAFLEWVRLLEERPYDVVDLTDTEIAWRRPDGATTKARVTSLAHLNPDYVDILSLLDRAAPLSPSLRQQYQEMWQQLRSESAPLRILRADRLRSAPMTHLDNLVCAHTSDAWLSVMRVVGETMGNAWADDGIQVDDLVLCARVRALVDAGKLEARGDMSDCRRSEVRRPAATGLIK